MTNGAAPVDTPSDAADPPRFYLWAAAVLVVLSLAVIAIASQADPSETISAVDVKQLPVGPPAPELHPKGWLNSTPLASRDLSDKVVVYEFWSYACADCAQTLPHLRSWYERYRDDGLVVVGVHSPASDAEKNHVHVEEAVERLQVTWPVALDDDLAIWTDFNNRYRPAQWITDRQGRIRYVHAGDGGYEVSEDVIRTLLGVAESAPRAADPNSVPPPTG